LIVVMTDLVDQAGRYLIDSAEREWIDELALDARDDELTPATMVILGLASAELRTAPAVLALDSTRPYTVHTVLARADRFRSQFAELGATTKPAENLGPVLPAEFTNVPTRLRTAPRRHPPLPGTAAFG
jgi:hypothetical protein